MREILPEGTKIRVALDAPVDVISGKRLHGKFRDTDIRYEIKPKEIKQVIIQPGQPPLYLVSDAAGETDHTQAYTKGQLLPVKPDEQGPREAAIRPIKKKDEKTKKEVKTYIVEKILDRKKENNRVMYKIKWKGFRDSTWEPRVELMKDVSKLILEYEKEHK
jgi:hypothetical protein